MSGSPEQDQDEEEDRRAEGKGSGPDDDDDPADGFEGGGDSQQVDDAQQMIDSFASTEENSGGASGASIETGSGEVGTGGAGSDDDVDTNTESLVEQTEGEFNERETFESGDEQFLANGDIITFDDDGEDVRGVVKQLPGNDMVGVELADGENVTVETWDIQSYQSKQRALDDTREQLREHFSDVGQHSTALEDYTDDTKYREFQSHLRDAPETAKDSPMYENNPQMETVSAILATTDADTADTISQIQSAAQNDLPDDMEVYRGIDVDDEFMDSAEEAMENDGTISDEGFQSATINEDVADGFGNVTLNIQTDHGVYVRAASEHAGEDEVLLPAGTEYEVNNVDRENNTVDVTATGGFDFNSVDVDFIRDRINEDNLSYAEAVEEVL